VTALIEKYYWMGIDVIEVKTFSSANKGYFSFQHLVLEMMLTQDVVLENVSEEQEKQLFLLSLEQQEIKNNNPDIFSGLNKLPTYLLYAKKMIKDKLADGNMLNRLLNFIQTPNYIDQSTKNYLNDYVQFKTK